MDIENRPDLSNIDFVSPLGQRYTTASPDDPLVSKTMDTRTDSLQLVRSENFEYGNLTRSKFTNHRTKRDW